MITVAARTKVFLYCKPIDMRKGMDGLAGVAATVLKVDPYAGHVFVFRSRRAGYMKLLHWDGSGLSLYAKRMEKGAFVWPAIVDEQLHLSSGQLQLLIEGTDWRRTVATDAKVRPSAV